MRGTERWGANQVAATKADGSDFRMLARGQNVYANLRWSRDGTKLVGGVFVVNSDGSGLRKVGHTGDRPSWSPDGRWIVYANGGDIYVVKPDGSEERQLTDTQVEEADPVWSPVG